MSSDQSLEVMRLNPGEISGKRLDVVGRGVELIAADIQRRSDTSASRVLTHPLVGLSDQIPDMWQQDLGRPPAAPQSAEVTNYESQVKAGVGESKDYASADDLLREALSNVEKAYNGAETQTGDVS